MKTLTILLTFIFLLLVMPTTSYAVVAPAAQPEVVVSTAKQKRLEKRIKKFAQKIEKQALKNKAKAAPYDLWDDSNFRLGVLLLVVALGLAVISAIGILPGFFGFMAGLFALGGFVFIILGLVNYA